MPDESEPQFCPYCGEKGTLSTTGGVFVEEGEYDDARDRYEAEGSAEKLGCRACGRGFVQWESDVCEAEEEETSDAS